MRTSVFVEGGVSVPVTTVSVGGMVRGSMGRTVADTRDI